MILNGFEILEPDLQADYPAYLACESIASFHCKLDSNSVAWFKLLAPFILFFSRNLLFYHLCTLPNLCRFFSNIGLTRPQFRFWLHFSFLCSFNSFGRFSFNLGESFLPFIHITTLWSLNDLLFVFFQLDPFFPSFLVSETTFYTISSSSDFAMNRPNPVIWVISVDF